LQARNRAHRVDQLLWVARVVRQPCAERSLEVAGDLGNATGLERSPDA
jgi:hypothetical protein